MSAVAVATAGASRETEDDRTDLVVAGDEKLRYSRFDDDEARERALERMLADRAAAVDRRLDALDIANRAELRQIGEILPGVTVIINGKLKEAQDAIRREFRERDERLVRELEERDRREQEWRTQEALLKQQLEVRLRAVELESPTNRKWSRAVLVVLTALLVGAAGGGAAIATDLFGKVVRMYYVSPAPVNPTPGMLFGTDPTSAPRKVPQ